MNANRDHFGPWTTALHHTNRLELSAFWRQRLRRLRSVQTLPAGLGSRRLTVFACIAIALLLLPRIELQRLAAADDDGLTATNLDLAAKRLDAADASSPFIATFSNGVQVELIGLSENPSKDKPWWQPDGSPLKTRPYARVPAIMGDDPGTIRREVCWRWLDEPYDPDFDTNWTILPHTSGAGGGTAFDTAGQKIPDLNAWAIQMRESPETCTLAFSVSVDHSPWTTIFSDDGQHDSGMSRSDFGRKQGATFSPSRNDGDGTSITIAYQIPDQAVRLIAVDKEGAIHTPISSSGGGVFGFNQRTFRFANLLPNQIKRFDLQGQTRKFETIEFRNVSLDPAKRTKVEIVRPSSEPPADKTDDVMPKIEPGDILMIRLLGGLPDEPIADLFRVEPSGNVPLGPSYGRVAIAGLTYEEAENALTRHLENTLEHPIVQVTDGEWELERRKRSSQ
jgi:hypothetical protein